jgi:outer membrane protein assembly factor BamC
MKYPMTRFAPFFLRLSLCVFSAVLAGCGSIIPDSKVDYKTKGETKATKLDVPPDLSQISRESRYALPGVGVSANEFNNNRTAQRGTGVTNAMGDVRLERLGTDRWLVVGRSVDQIYPIVRDFWKESGFTLTQENQVLGLLETEWAENRAKLPQDLLRRTLGKVVDGLYSTGERDKYRTQLEPLTAQSTEIRISHRGMVEVFAGVMKDSLIWQPRPSDPGLENEFLRRLMLKLGAPAQQADQAVAKVNIPNTSAKAENIAGQTSIILNEGFDIAWRRVGLALDRTGFTVEDRDRRTGTYFVRFVDTPDDKEGNFFTRMFKAKKVPVPVKYRIAIAAQVNGGSRAVVLNIDGQNESSPASQKIAKLLLDELK